MNLKLTSSFLTELKSMEILFFMFCIYLCRLVASLIVIGNYEPLTNQSGKNIYWINNWTHATGILLNLIYNILKSI